jgi:hypothetical protein
MHLTVLAEPACPNAPVLEDRLAVVLDDRVGVSVSRQVIFDESEAARWGMHGSPTLLIDGVDPFAEPGQLPSMSCRLYRDDNDQTSGAPSASQLRQVIKQARAAATEPGDPAWLDAPGRGGRGRVAPADRGLRAVHQAVLRSFARTGAAPSMSSLARHAAPFEVAQVLAELAEGDFLCLLIMPVRSPRRTRSLRCRPGTGCGYQAARPFMPCARSTPWACPRWSACP